MTSSGRLILACLLLVLLSACGQTGALYLPDPVTEQASGVDDEETDEAQDLRL